MAAARKELVYAGAVTHDGKVVHAYYLIGKDGIDQRAQVFPEPLGDFPPGAVCSYVVQADGAQVVRAGATFVRIHDDVAAVTEWRARHDALLASEQAWATPTLPKPFAALAPIKAAYKRLDEERQGILIAQVIRYIVGADRAE